MMAQRLRLVQRLVLRAPTPPEATRGLTGMRIADAVLKQYQSAGILIGGLAKEIWRGVTSDRSFSQHKDVDVLVLTRGCRQHPKQWEQGVDWWVSHRVLERPTNGADCGLLWRIALRPHMKPTPGLYLCPLNLLKESIAQEKRILGDECKVEGGTFHDAPGLLEFPELPEQILRTRWADLDAEIAGHCKMISG